MAEIDNSTGKVIKDGEVTFLGSEKEEPVTKKSLIDIVDSIETHTRLILSVKEKHKKHNALLKDIYKQYYNHHFTLSNIASDLVDSIDEHYQEILTLIDKSEGLYKMNLKVFVYSNQLVKIDEDLLDNFSNSLLIFCYEFVSFQKWSYAYKLKGLGCKSLKNI